MESSEKQKPRSIWLFSFVLPILLISGFFIYARNLQNPPLPQSPTINISEVVHDEKKLARTLEGIGIKQAMSKLVEESGGGSVYDCHQQAHTIGRIGYEIFKEKAFQECNAACHSGCYHGAMEIFLHEEGTKDLAVDIDRVCDLFNTNFGVFECLHGVGHGVLAYVDYDMPQGLKECQKLEDSFSQSSCFGGLFMENILTAQGLGASQKSEHSTKWANHTDPHFPCNGIDKSNDIQHQCYLMQTSWMLTISNYDFDKVLPECLKAPEKMIPVCFKSFGRDAAGHTLRNVPRIIEICSKVSEEHGYRDECAVGALNVIVDFWGPGLKHQATELCWAFAGSAKKICYQTLAYRLPDVFGTDMKIRDEICIGFEDEYQSLCKTENEISTQNSNIKKIPTLLQNETSPIIPLLISPVVEMKDDGFFPKEFRIKQHTKVIFQNHGNELHWPASNIHPSHQIYPEFDPKKPIVPGENWFFEFNHPGAWRFHDHLFPEISGVIMVE